MRPSPKTATERKKKKNERKIVSLLQYTLCQLLHDLLTANCRDIRASQSYCRLGSCCERHQYPHDTLNSSCDSGGWHNFAHIFFLHTVRILFWIHLRQWSVPSVIGRYIPANIYLVCVLVRPAPRLHVKRNARTHAR